MFSRRHPARASDDAVVHGTEEEIRARLKGVEYEIHMDRLRRENVALVCEDAALAEILANDEARSQQVLGEFKYERSALENGMYANDAERLAAAGEQIAELSVRRDGLMEERKRLRGST